MWSWRICAYKIWFLWIQKVQSRNCQFPIQYNTILVGVVICHKLPDSLGKTRDLRLFRITTLIWFGHRIKISKIVMEKQEFPLFGVRKWYKYAPLGRLNPSTISNQRTWITINVAPTWVSLFQVRKLPEVTGHSTNPCFQPSIPFQLMSW